MKHVLVVDDEKHITTLFDDELTDAGYRVTTATSGRTALEMIATELPDLVILDIRMPDMHGLEVLKIIRAKHGDLPVIMCTAMQGAEDDYTVWESQVSGYLTKPVDLDKLRAMVEEVIGPGE